MSYQAKAVLTQAKQLKVQEISLPFTIVGSATPASVVITVADPSLLFINTEGVTQITAALASDDTAPTYATKSDAGGDFSVLINIGEEVLSVLSCDITSISAEKAPANGIFCTAPTDGIVAGGSRDKIALDAKNFLAYSSSVTVKGCITVRYTTAQ